MANSSACPAVTTNGNAYNFVSPTVAGAGCLPSAITGVTTLLPHYLSQADPFAGLYSTTIPSDATCKTLSQNTYTKTTGSGSSRVTETWLYSYETNKARYCNSGNSSNGFKFTG